jgi:hypothetical protein
MPGTERQTSHDLTFLKTLKKFEFTQVQNRMVINRGWGGWLLGVGEWGDVGQVYKISVRQEVKFKRFIDNIVTTVNSSVLHS